MHGSKHNVDGNAWQKHVRFFCCLNNTPSMSQLPPVSLAMRPPHKVETLRAAEIVHVI